MQPNFTRPLLFAVPLLFVLALLSVSARAENKSGDTVSLTLTYTERNGLSGPSSGAGDLAIGTSLAALGGAGFAQSFKNIDKLVQDAINNPGSQPKTTGEIASKYMNTDAAQKAASLPRNSGYRGKLKATLKWDEKKKAYLVKSGTYEWKAFNNSRFTSKGHEQYTNLIAQGSHKLKPDEVKLSYDGERLSKALGPKAKKSATSTYSLKLNIKPERKVITGNAGWVVGKGGVYETTEKYTAAGVEVLTVDEYKPTADGNDLRATSHRAREMRKPEFFDYKIHYTADERKITQGKGHFSESWLNMLGSQVGISWSVHLPGDLVADAGGPYFVERGGEVTFDGSASQGKIKKYIWTFKPLTNNSKTPPSVSGPVAKNALLFASAVDGGQSNSSTDAGHSASNAGQSSSSDGGTVTKEGEKVTAKLLADTEVTLTVSGPQGQDQDAGTSKVSPRDFHTKFEPDVDLTLPVPEEGESTTVRSYTIRPVNGGAIGFNMCGVEQFKKLSAWKTADHIFHFADRETADWENKAYVLEKCSDPKGPYDGWWQVKEILFYIQRGNYISPYYQPNGPVPDATVNTPNWYTANMIWRQAELDRAKKYAADDVVLGDFNAKAFLDAALAHERTHSQIIKEALAKKGADPGLEIEALVRKDKQALKDEIWSVLMQADKNINDAGDTLDKGEKRFSYNNLWAGKILVWSDADKNWIVSSDDKSDVWGDKKNLPPK